MSLSLMLGHFYFQILTPYLSLFPFPFYAVVKTVRQLPSVLAESIRQWFEVSMQSI